MKSFFKDLFTGWHQTIKKWSVQVGIAEGFVMGLLATIPGLWPWVMPVAYVSFWLVRTAASNLTQEAVQTYDPRKFYLKPIGDLDA